ncbi:hypothetical protein EST38_g4157 [Candolleomyces aberdarensis]|uniref:Cytochrome P450 n=1 Tax=Candolleomyces aberdarensis TaxID=2316362 RepID=A0A4Q2DQE2_9AGAR|nr:hypothetical protein EST38_g4157 [Candolleomyces aberdarensis]
MDSIALCLALIAAISLVQFSRRTKRLPPGPKGLPIIGNLLDVPLDKDFWMTFREWGHRWGDVLHMNIFGQHFIILNSMEATRDLLEKRGKIYSTRHSLPMFEIAEYDKLVAFEQNTKRWADGRKLLMQFLTGRELPKLFPVVEDECSKLPARLHANPGKLGDILEQSVVAVIMRTTYGYTPDPVHDRFTHVTFKLLDEMLVAARPTNLLNIFPFCKYSVLRHLPSWLPGMGSKRLAYQFRETMHKVVKEPFEWSQEHKDDVSVSQSLVAKFQNSGLDIDDRSLAEWTAAVQFIAGADTTTFTLHAAVKALMMYPEVQKKAQAVIDNAIGHRLPTMADRPQLAYIDAIIKEVSRWFMLGPFDSDDYYKGYFIPKGSIILPNMGAVASDPSIYPDPENFIPERHIPSILKDTESGLDEHADQTQLDPASYVFGFGRRVCPGKLLALAEIWLHLATLLKVYDIVEWKSEKDGVKIEIGEDRGPTMDMPRRPSPFKCALRLRNEASLDFVQSGAAGAL